MTELRTGSIKSPATDAAPVSASNEELLSQLNTLLRLTHTEEMIAQVRRTQATSAEVERELARNAQMCRERIGLLRELISELDGVYDVFGATVGRLSAAAKSQLEQGITLTEALFTDLALEHQLLDRARFVKRLGEAADQVRVVEVMERLETAHSATVEWLDTILAEVAAGQPAKLRPTTAQAAVATGRRIAFFGARQAAHAVNVSLAALQQVQHRFGDKAGQVQHRLSEAAEEVQHRVSETAEEVQHRVVHGTDEARERLQRLGRDTGEVLGAGRDAALHRAEDLAREEGSIRLAERVHETREVLGVLDVDELPIDRYDTLNAGMASARIEKLTTVRDVEVVLAYERANKNRPSVVRAAEGRISDLHPELSSDS